MMKRVPLAPGYEGAAKPANRETIRVQVFFIPSSEVPYLITLAALLASRGDKKERKIPPRFIVMGDCPWEAGKIQYAGVWPGWIPPQDKV
jgi:hypothetical protein